MTFRRLFCGLALGALAAGTLTSCAADRQRAFEQRRTTAFDLYAEGEDLERRGEYDLALQKYRAALEMEVLERPAFLYKVGRMHHLLGDPERALLFYDRALELAPDFSMASAQRELARLQLVEQGVVRDRAELDATPPPRAPLAPTVQTPLVPTPPPAPRTPAATVHESLAGAQARTILFPELQGAPDTALDDERRRATEATESRRWTDAALAWARVVDQAPEDISARLELARAYLRTGRTRRSFDMYEAAAQMEPANPEVHLQWANACVEAGDWRAAVEHYGRALALDPDNVRVLNNLGALHLNRGNFGESLTLFRDIVARRPDWAPARLNLALALEGYGAPAAEIIPHLEAYLRLGGARRDEAESWLLRLRQLGGGTR